LHSIANATTQLYNGTSLNTKGNKK